MGGGEERNKLSERDYETTKKTDRNQEMEKYSEIFDVQSS